MGVIETTPGTGVGRPGIPDRLAALLEGAPWSGRLSWGHTASHALDGVRMLHLRAACAVLGSATPPPRHSLRAAQEKDPRLDENGSAANLRRHGAGRQLRPSLSPVQTMRRIDTKTERKG